MSRENNLEEKEDVDGDINYDELLLPEEQQFYNNIQEVIGFKTGKFLVKLEDGAERYVILPNDHPLVKAYLLGLDQEEREKVYKVVDPPMPTITDLREWNMCPWRPNDDVLGADIDID